MSTIPKLHYVSQGDHPEQHIDRIREACTSGAELVQLDLIGYDHATLLKTAQDAKDITSLYQTRLIISNHVDIAKAVKADGIYLKDLERCPLKIRDGLFSWQIIGAAAKTPEDCETLVTRNVNYIGLETFDSVTDPGLETIIKVTEFATTIASQNSVTPLIAFGNIPLEDVANLLDVGAYGVALSQVLTDDFKKISQFQQLLGNPSSQEQVWISKDHKL